MDLDKKEIDIYELVDIKIKAWTWWIMCLHKGSKWFSRYLTLRLAPLEFRLKNHYTNNRFMTRRPGANFETSVKLGQTVALAEVCTYMHTDTHTHKEGEGCLGMNPHNLVCKLKPTHLAPLRYTASPLQNTQIRDTEAASLWVSVRDPKRL